MWPRDLRVFRSVVLPSSNIDPKSVARPDMPLTTTDYETEPPGACQPPPIAFLKAVRKLLRKWNLERITKTSQDTYEIRPARIWCAVDALAQGTYVFIPRYYNWSSLRNGEETDFAPLRQCLNHSFEKFRPCRGRRLASRRDECLSYVMGKVGTSKPSAVTVFRAVDAWLKKEKLRSTSQRTIYRKFARKHFHLPS